MTFGQGRAQQVVASGVRGEEAQCPKAIFHNRFKPKGLMSLTKARKLYLFQLHTDPTETDDA